ncbi:MAG: hypothetical protein ACRD6X_09145 [Pyrinomonadaceae bacterium]
MTVIRTLAFAMALIFGVEAACIVRYKTTSPDEELDQARNHLARNIPDNQVVNSSYLREECSRVRDAEALSRMSSEILALDLKVKRTTGRAKAALKKKLVELSLEHERISRRLRQTEESETRKLLLIDCSVQ